MSVGKTTVIFLTYNHARWLEKSLQSLFQQDLTNCRVLIFDDGSSDETPELIKRFLRNSLSGQKEIFTYLFEDNWGLPFHMLRVMAEAAKYDADYMCFCEGDDYWSPSRFAVQRNYLDRNKNCQIVFSNVEVVDDAGGAQSLYFPSDFSFSRTLEGYLESGLINPNTGTFFRVRNDLRNDRNWWASIDYGKWIRLLDAGGTIDYVPEVLGSYRRGVGISSAGHPLRRVFTDLAHLNLCNEVIVRYPQLTRFALARYVKCFSKLGMEINISVRVPN